MANTELIPVLLVALIMTVLGSLAKYQTRPVSEKVSLSSHMVVSIFAGMMMALYGLDKQWSLSLMGLACGAAGWQGAAILKRLPWFSQAENGDNYGKN
ncbi:TPA: hypothetical protein I8235_000025 [Kluyvera intermedia]|nr:hypothetical protein [Kluyvera intermedia]